MAERKSIHGLWSGKFAFILAATGSAVGLGNIWKFPYITGENGGGAFVLFYLLCIAVIGVPILMAEVMLGRRGRQNPIGSMNTLAIEENASTKWKWIGIMGVVTGIMILSYYSVIGGWALSYFFEAVSGTFKGISAEASGEHFGALVGSWDTLLGWHTMFMGLTLYVISKGVRGGLEKAVTLLMPALFILLLVMVGYAMQTGSFQKGLDFLFSADFSKLNKESALTAMGHAFFTLSLGMGAIMAYGSYLPKNVSIAGAGIAIALADTVVALLAGMAIFPIVFANGLEPSSGPGLIFTTLPIAFGQMPFGNVFAAIFFLLLIFAAWSSAISLIEPAVAWLVEKTGVTRFRATILMGGATWLLGIGSILSFNVWKNAQFLDKTFFDWMDYLTSNILLPFGGLLIAVFAGWIMRKKSSQDELGLSTAMHGLWSFLVKYVAITAVLIVMFKVSGLMDWLISLL
ncbi:MAG: sodium-dependent transporter [Thiotrichaceae bacterium]